MDRFKIFKEAFGAFWGKEWTTTEKILVVLNCILLGAVLGVIFGPRKGSVMIGSNNGSGMAPLCDYEEGWIDEED